MILLTSAVRVVRVLELEPLNIRKTPYAAELMHARNTAVRFLAGTSTRSAASTEQRDLVVLPLAPEALPVGRYVATEL